MRGDLILVGNKYGIKVTATEKGSMTKELFANELKRILPLMTEGISPAPSILLSDGHRSRLTRTAIQELNNHNVYLILTPSHTTTLLAPLDNGPNSLFQRLYQQTYTIHAIQKNFSLSLADKIEIIGIAYQLLKREENLPTLLGAWRVVGMENGVPSPNTLPLKKFQVGNLFRDESLPKISKCFVDEVFQLSNLISPPLAPITISRNMITMIEREEEKHNLVESLVTQRNEEWHKQETSLQYHLERVQSDRCNVVTTIFKRLDKNRFRLLLEEKEVVVDETNSEDEENHENDEREVEEKDDEITKGSTTYVSTNMGCIPQLDSVIALIEETERKKTEEEEKRKKKLSEMQAQMEKERPLRQLLLKLHFITDSNRHLIGKMIDLFIKTNKLNKKPELKKILNEKRNRKGERMVEWLQQLQPAQINNLVGLQQEQIENLIENQPKQLENMENFQPRCRDTDGERATLTEAMPIVE